MRWPLRFQILVPFVAVMLCAIVAVSVLAAVQAAQRVQREIERQLQGIGATLAESTFPLTEVVLRQMHGLSGAEFVYASADDTLVAGSRPLAIDTARLPAVDTSDQLRLGSAVDHGGERFFQMVLAVKGRGSQPPGRLTILYPERVWREARSQAVWPPLIVGAVALAATTLLSSVIAGRLARPILHLRRHVARIAESDFTPMNVPDRNDELRDLAGDVNRLAVQLSQMDRAIRRSERLALLGQLAGGLVHHLRNHVTGALMAVQLHARECRHDRESLEVALRQLSLTEENLKRFLATPEAPDTATGARVPCSLAKIVQEVVGLVSPLLKHRRIALEWEPAASLEIVAHPDQLRQLLVNLVLNAAEATVAGGWVRIETEGLPDGTDDGTNGLRAIVRVRDNGPGPPPQVIEHLFEPFNTSKSEGVGLGLAVSMQIARAHGGEIVFARDGGETCFEVHLPVPPAAVSRRLLPTSA